MSPRNKQVVLVIDVTRIARWGLALVAVVACAAPLWLSAVAVPHTFSNGAVADAASVNANFQTLASAVTTLQSDATTFRGQVASFAGSTCPSGWLPANGSAVSRTTYAELFAYLGTTYGAGNGSTTFGLPDLRGEFIRGLDGGRGIDTGRVLGSSQISTQVLVDDDAGQVVGAIDFTTNNLPALGYEPSQVSSVAHHYNNAATSGTAGSTFARSIRPRNVALLYCIRF